MERVVLLQPWGATTDACGLPCPRHVRTAMLLGTAASPEAKVREQARSLPRALKPQCAAPAACDWLRQREVVVRYYASGYYRRERTGGILGCTVGVSRSPKAVHSKATLAYVSLWARAQNTLGGGAALHAHPWYMFSPPVHNNL